MNNRFVIASLSALLAGALPLIAIAEPETAPAGADFVRNTNFESPGADLAGRIAFTANINGVDRIFAVDLDTKRFRAIADLPGNNSYPSWSPDGTKIAFTSDRDKRRVTYIANWDGSDQRRLTKDHPGAEDHPSWSPDGTEVLFTYDSGAGEDSDSNVASANVATGAVRILTDFKSRNTTPRWSPDGSSISYSTNRFWPGWDVCIFNLRDQIEKCPLNGSLSYCRADWAHSGKFLAYSFGQSKSLDLGVLDMTAGTSSTSQTGPGKAYDPAWSPDDRFIIFAHQSEGAEIFNLYLSDQKSMAKILISSTYSLRYPTWTGARTIDLEARRILEAEGMTPHPRPPATRPPVKAPDTTLPTGTPNP